MDVRPASGESRAPYGDGIARRRQRKHAGAGSALGQGEDQIHSTLASGRGFPRGANAPPITIEPVPKPDPLRPSSADSAVFAGSAVRLATRASKSPHTATTSSETDNERTSERQHRD